MPKCVCDAESFCIGESRLPLSTRTPFPYLHPHTSLQPHNFFLGVDPGPGACIGGMCATCCSGTNAVRYGTMKDQVVNLTVMLADGTIVKTGQRARKSSAGYDLARIIVGVCARVVFVGVRAFI